MKDCDGNEIAVGDVVKILHGTVTRTIVRFEDAWAVMERRTRFGLVTVKAKGESLRLVRRKEPR